MKKLLIYAAMVVTAAVFLVTLADIKTRYPSWTDEINLEDVCVTSLAEVTYTEPYYSAEEQTFIVDELEISKLNKACVQYSYQVIITGMDGQPIASLEGDIKDTVFTVDIAPVKVEDIMKTDLILQK